MIYKRNCCFKSFLKVFFSGKKRLEGKTIFVLVGVGLGAGREGGKGEFGVEYDIVSRIIEI